MDARSTPPAAQDRPAVSREDARPASRRPASDRKDPSPSRLRRRSCAGSKPRSTTSPNPAAEAASRAIPATTLQRGTGSCRHAMRSSSPAPPTCPMPSARRWTSRWRTSGRPDFPQFTLGLFRDLKKVFKTDAGPGVPLPRLRHRRLGGGADQHALARRPGARRPLRPVLPSLGRDVPAPRPRGGRHRGRMGRGRAGRDLCRAPRRRQGPSHQGGAGLP